MASYLIGYVIPVYSTGETSHAFKSLEDIRQDIVNQFEEILKTTNEKMSNLSREEKAAWERLDKETDDLNIIAARVEMWENEKVSVKCSQIISERTRFTRLTILTMPVKMLIKCMLINITTI